MKNQMKTLGITLTIMLGFALHVSSAFAEHEGGAGTSAGGITHSATVASAQAKKDSTSVAPKPAAPKAPAKKNKNP